MGHFKTFDNTINYIVGFLGVLGLVGNFLCTITLGRKEMRSNCFHQLSLGKIRNFLYICYFLHLFSVRAELGRIGGSENWEKKVIFGKNGSNPPLN